MTTYFHLQQGQERRILLGRASVWTREAIKASDLASVLFSSLITKYDMLDGQAVSGIRVLAR